MQLAVNYSPQAADLLTTGQIDIDRFKCPDWPDLIAAAQPFRPVYVHFDLRAGHPQPPDVDWEAVAALRTQTGTPFINLHIGSRPDEFPHIPPDSADPAHLDEIAACALRDVQAAVDRFGAEHVIVENVPYYGPGTHRLWASVDPAVIGHVVERTGCGLLLDLSHGMIASHYASHDAGRDGVAYLEALPVDRLHELHVTGIATVDGRRTDHLPLTDPDWATFQRAMDRIRAGAWRAPEMVAFEYGGVGPLFEWRSERDVLAAQVPRLLEAVRGVTQKHGD